MAEFPSLPLWTDAWIADTKHLSRAERGMYHDLLVLMWRTPGCSVPNDGAWLAKHLDIREKHETEMLFRIITEFCNSDGNRVWQKRLRKEFAYCKRQSARRKGKKLKDKSPDRKPVSDSIPIPIPIPIPLEREARSPSGSRLPDEWKLSDELRDFAVSQGIDPEGTMARFCDYWRAQPGTKGRKLDWEATWRIWCRREHETPKPNGNGHAKPGNGSMAVTETPWASRIAMWRKSGEWLKMWGAPPGDPACAAPKEMLQ